MRKETDAVLVVVRGEPERGKETEISPKDGTEKQPGAKIGGSDVSGMAGKKTGGLHKQSDTESECPNRAGVPGGLTAGVSDGGFYQVFHLAVD